jgi:signal transduction histidine kinase
VSNIAVETSPAALDPDLPITIAAKPISTRDRNIALAAIVVLAILDAIIIPFASVHLPRVDPFIPVLQTVMCAVDLLTATLLFAQYSIQPLRAIIPVASGYVFSGLFAFIQTLAFPGAYSPTGVIGDGLNSAAWFFVLWHTNFPLAIMLYVLTKDSGARLSKGSARVNISSTLVCVLTAAAGLTWLATHATQYFPTLYSNAIEQTPFGANINLFLWGMNIAAFILLLVRRRTVLDLWLTVTLFAWWPNFLVAIAHSVVRFSAGWYMARLVALVASSTLLIVLLAESMALYARFANAFVLLRRERADRLANVQAATAAMAHELRQPLTGIATRGAAGMNWLKRAPPELNKAHQCFQSIVDASLRANEIIAAIRDLYKKTPTEHTMLQINDVVREVLALAQDELRVEAVVASAEYHENLPEIHAAHTQIQQAILNLVKNAIEAMRSVAPDKRRLRLVTGLDGNSGVAVYVQDSGPGIAPDIQERIFEPFFTTKPNGTGLGLSICRTIAEDHGGQLRLSKTHTRGTSFEFVLPIVTAGHRAADIITNVDGMVKRDRHERVLTDVNKLIRTVISLAYMDLRKHSIEYQASLSEQLPPIMGNEVQLQQVILNLMMNAIEAMKSADHRVLSIKSESADRDRVRVSIEHTGNGIDSSNRIFKPLFMTKAHGTEKGLAICRSIIESHNGKMTWASAGDSRGAIFRFELPISGT